MTLRRLCLFVGWNISPLHSLDLTWGLFSFIRMIRVKIQKYITKNRFSIPGKENELSL